jgi:hypothetical protein
MNSRWRTLALVFPALIGFGHAAQAQEARSGELDRTVLKKPADAPAASDGTQLPKPDPKSEQAILDTLQLAYRWGYPLIAMATNNTEYYGSTVNAFYSMKTATDDKAQNGPGFNAEVLYSAGALDLSQEPMVFTLPPVGDRFVVVPVQDAWGNIDRAIGTRVDGNDGGTFLITGPGWKGTVPAGMTQVPLHTSVGFLPIRTMVKNTDDAKAFAATTQDKYTLTPLSRWGTGAPNPNRDSLKDPLISDPARNYLALVNAMPTNEYFNRLNQLLVHNPPYDYDAPVLKEFAKLGIGAGLEFKIEKFSPAVREAMKAFGQNDPKVAAAKFAGEGMNEHRAKIAGHFGTEYFERYLLVFGGLGGQLTEDAMYFWLKTDESGQKLKGDTSYVVHFDKDKIPKTKAFWSLTLYNKDFYLPEGMPLGRHVRNSNSGMKLNADGSLDLYLQPDNPGPDKVDNWLPTPRGQEYFCLMRIYWPEGDVLSGKWQQPLPKVVDGQ